MCPWQGRSAGVVAQVVAKTDGVPLFVEELTKMVLESGLLQEQEDRYALTGPLPPLAIPSTLHDSLMARLDRLGAMKGLTQLGATLGREFSCPAPGRLSVGRGHRAPGAAPVGGSRVPLPARAAAAGDVRLQACPDSGRGVSVVVAEHAAAVPADCSGVGASFGRRPRPSPSCWRIHYTEAGLSAQAVVYWQQAGQHAVEHSALWKPSVISARDWRC